MKTEPRPKLISDFMAQRWDNISDEDVKLHFMALTKALYVRWGRDKTRVPLAALKKHVSSLPALEGN
jgi:hypothetical protein